MQTDHLSASTTPALDAFQTNTVPVPGGELQLQAEGPHLHPPLPRRLRSPQHTQGWFQQCSEREILNVYFTLTAPICVRKILEMTFY